MRAEQIRVEPFEYIHITDCRFEKKINDHGSAWIRGYIGTDREEEYLAASMQEMAVTVWALDEEGEEQIFYLGIAEEFKIISENRQKILELVLVPYTRLMDLQPRMRTFQNPQMPYQEALELVMKDYQDPGVIFGSDPAAVLGEFLVQYQETDWELAKRMASRLNTVLVPDCLTPGVTFYFGLPEGKQAEEINPVSCQTKKMVGEYLYKEQNRVDGITENDEMCLIVEDRELRSIGDRVIYGGREFCIAEAVSEWNGQELVHVYHLKSRAGLMTPRTYHTKLIGVSLDGIVLEAAGDMVKLQLGVDPPQDPGTARWFAYSTVYSSPDGSGWYFMPDRGDEVRLYFPTEKEKHSYVISAVHQMVQGQGAAQTSAGQASGDGYRCDPGCKEIASGKKRVRLSPNAVTMTNGEGLSITMADGQGITINSTGNLTISAGGNLEIASSGGTVEIVGAVRVDMSQELSMISLDAAAVTLSGQKIQIQE